MGYGRNQGRNQTILKTIENGIKTIKTLLDIMKAILTGKFIALYIKKQNN